MEIEMIPYSGHVLNGAHISKPTRRYRVDWDSPKRNFGWYFNQAEIVWPNCRRFAFCWADSATDAEQICKYHHGLYGTNFVAVEDSTS